MAPTSAAPPLEAPPARAYAERFGALLRRSRRERSLSVRQIAARTGHAFTAADLRAFERGEQPLDADVLRRLCTVYDVPLQSLPEHQPIVIDLVSRELRVDGTAVPLSGSGRPREDLEQYVRLVNRLRSQPMRSPATLRRDDTEALAEALELEATEVMALLSEVIDTDAATRRRVLALRTGTSALAAVVVIGAAVAMATRDSGAETAVLSSTSEPAADPGPGAEEAPAGDAVAPIPPTDTVFGPYPAVDRSLPPPAAEDPPPPPAETEDETRLAPAQTLEREDFDAAQDGG